MYILTYIIYKDIYLSIHLSIYLIIYPHMGACQNSGPLLGPLNTRYCIILRTPRGTIILTTARIVLRVEKRRPPEASSWLPTAGHRLDDLRARHPPPQNWVAVYFLGNPRFPSKGSLKGDIDTNGLLLRNLNQITMRGICSG